MPFVNAIVNLLTEIKGWLLALGGVVTVVVCVGHALGYQSASATEKAEKIKAIRNTIFMGGGISFFAWFALYVYEHFSNVGS